MMDAYYDKDGIFKSALIDGIIGLNKCKECSAEMGFGEDSKEYCNGFCAMCYSITTEPKEDGK